jgi:hypothetical protein
VAAATKWMTKDLSASEACWHLSLHPRVVEKVYVKVLGRATGAGCSTSSDTASGAVEEVVGTGVGRSGG